MWNEFWTVVAGVPTTMGGQGSVTKVKRLSDGAYGALKELHPKHLHNTERRYRIHHEASALEALNGGGVPHLLDSNAMQWKEEGVPLFLIMEWIDGPTLAQVCSRQLLSLDESLDLITAILRTVEQCHAVDIFHRDLKPDNVILRASDVHDPVLVDFGMAWAQPDPNAERPFETDQGQELGNRFLRLPEHAPGREHRDSRSDLAMAIGILFFALTGYAPRTLLDEQQRMPHEAHEGHFPHATKDDPRWHRLLRLFTVGFQFSLEQRFQNTAQMRHYLTGLVPETPTDVQGQIEQELSQIADILQSAKARSAERDKGVMRTGSERFQDAVHRGIAGSGFVLGGSGPNFADRDTRDTIGFFMQGQTRDPQVRYSHVVTTAQGRVIAMVGVEGATLREYYSGPLADVEGLCEAAELEGGRVALELLRVMRVKLHEKFS